MATITVFNSVSLDGYFTDKKGDLSWAHKQDPEWIAFSSENASGRESRLLFGRVTYEMMVSYWPTAEARQALPVVAEGMNARSKIVFSRTLDKVTWNNTRLIKGDLVSEVRKLKESGPDMVILGSGTIVSQLTSADLIDQHQIVLNPIVLGAGRTLFEGIKEKVALKLTKTRAFKNGNVVLWYER